MDRRQAARRAEGSGRQQQEGRSRRLPGLLRLLLSTVFTWLSVTASGHVAPAAAAADCALLCYLGVSREQESKVEEPKAQDTQKKTVRKTLVGAGLQAHSSSSSKHLIVLAATVQRYFICR